MSRSFCTTIRTVRLVSLLNLIEPFILPILVPRDSKLESRGEYGLTVPGSVSRQAQRGDAIEGHLSAM